jgi:dipeptidyl aminopeptidase/acylaminoacyl peptidase
MIVFRRFAFAVLCILYFIACNATKTIPVEALRDTAAVGTSRFVFSTSGSTAEAYLTRPVGTGPFPLMILLHGVTLWSIDAESVVPEAEAFASDLCYAGLAISLPGYGTRQVPAGMDPNITVKAVLDAVSLVKKLPWIDSKRLYLYGFSRGAFFAALLASRLDGVKGVILHSGAYDLNRFYQDTSWWFRSMLNPSGQQNPKLISILPEVPMWHAPTLILHGEEDRVVSVQQANLLSESLEAAKKPYRFVLYPNSGHRLPSEDVQRQATAFLAENSGSACRGRILTSR